MQLPETSDELLESSFSEALDASDSSAEDKPSVEELPGTTVSKELLLKPVELDEGGTTDAEEDGTKLEELSCTTVSEEDGSGTSFLGSTSTAWNTCNWTFDIESGTFKYFIEFFTADKESVATAVEK